MDNKKMLEQIDAAMQLLLSVQAALRAEAPVVLPSIATEESNGVCHYCKQPLADEKPIRGDHPRCYKELMRMVASNELTEAAIMEKGWLAPAKPAGRKRNATPARDLALEIIAKHEAKEITKPKKVADKKSNYRRDS